MENKDVLLEDIIYEIENCSPQKIEPTTEDVTFDLKFDPALAADLSGGISAFLVRAILRALKIDEHHVFRWRLENKYWQYQILNHYIPGCMAETFSLSQLIEESAGIQRIKELCNNGFFVKATLGDGSGRANTFDRTEELDEIILSHSISYENEEKWILQKKLNFTKEFRIHTFNRDLISGLTIEMSGQYLSDNHDAEQFVKRILERLPDTILQGTLIGWDIGITDTNELFYIIEANITGFHPEFNRGFQTSGYFADRTYAPIICAWLHNYFRVKFHISIGGIDNILVTNYPFFNDFMFYTSLFNDEHLQVLEGKLENSDLVSILYLGEDPDDRLIRLQEYFQIGHFCETYYLIVSEEQVFSATQMLTENYDIRILAENSLFRTEQYQLIKQLRFDIRKQVCCEQVLRLIPEKNYLII